ncbi:MAG: MFS transporter [Actinobacteria bacterium]|nr:MFS transporter [Actinomycetota bacterium]
MSGSMAPTLATGRPSSGPVYRLSFGLILDLSADMFLLFTLLWIAGPEGWTGIKTAAVIAALQLPALLGGWLGGLAIDRFGPRPLLVAQAAVRIVCLAVLTATVWTGRFPLVFVLVLGGINGALSPVGYAAARTMVPRLVDVGGLVRANALLAVADQAALILGAAAVGPLLETAGAGKSLLVPIAMMIVAAVLFVTLPRTVHGAVHVEPDAGASMPEIVEAPVEERRRMRSVIALIALSGAYYFAYGPVEPVLPAFTRDQLHAGSGAYSLLWVAFGIGALLGLTQSARFTGRRPGVVNATGAALWAIVTLPLVFCASVPPAVFVMVLSGVIWGPYLAIESTAVQQWTRPSIHGRVFGAQHATLALATPLGAAVGSLLLLRFSGTTVIGISIAACFVAGAVALCFPSIRRRPELFSATPPPPP